jgi:predicted HTH domain antitoxin
MTHVNVPLPDEVLETLHRSVEEVEADVRLAAALDWYRRGMISQGRAAEVAGVTRADFIDALAARQIPVVQLDPADLDRERGDA